MTTTEAGEDYTFWDSDALLKEYAAARECEEIVRFALEHQLSALRKGFEVSVFSEAGQQMTRRILDTLHDHKVLAKQITAITREFQRHPRD